MREQRPGRDDVEVGASHRRAAGFVGDGASVSFGEAIKRLGRSRWQGRASRSEFWYAWLFCMLLSSCSAVIFLGVFDLEGVDRLLSTIISVFVTIVFARRLHDVDRSGWWMLIAFTIVGLVPLFIWSIRKGDAGPNRFDLERTKQRLVPTLDIGNANTIEQLERLYRLRSNGAITDEEYEAIKAKMV